MAIKVPKISFNFTSTPSPNPLARLALVVAKIANGYYFSQMATNSMNFFGSSESVELQILKIGWDMAKYN